MTRSSLVDEIKRRGVVTHHQEPITRPDGRELAWMVDMRPVLLSHDGLRESLVAFGELVCRKHQVEQVGCLESAAVPLVAGLAFTLKIPGFTIRKQPKSHGRKRLIEGNFNASRPCVLVDDVLNSGMSLLQAANAVRSSGGTVDAAFAVVTYGKAASLGFPVYSAATLEDLGLGRLSV